MIMPGEFSGSQIAGLRPAGSSGSWAKTQPPSASEVRASGLRVDSAASDELLDSRIISAIGVVATQEFDGETGAVEPVQLFDHVGRSPVGYGHGRLLLSVIRAAANGSVTIQKLALGTSP
jgi:hypothetical protein